MAKQRKHRSGGSKQTEPLAALLEPVKDGIEVYENTRDAFNDLRRNLIARAIAKAEQLLGEGEILEAAKYTTAIQILYTRLQETAAKASPYVHPKISPKAPPPADNVTRVMYMPHPCKTSEEWQSRYAPSSDGPSNK